MRSVVVTGVSTGIGEASARALAAAGFRVFGSVRKAEDGARLAADLKEKFVPLLFDVTDAPAIARAAQDVRTALKGEKLAGLVNNAGVAVPGPLLYLTLDDVRRQLEINVIGQLAVTQAFAPLLGTDRSLQGAPGRIVMISSVAGQNGGPFTGAYAASKHALEGMSESLRRELIGYGIDVIVIGPGAVKTAIWSKISPEDVTRFANTPYAKAVEAGFAYAAESGAKGLPPERLGALVLHALTTARPKVRYPITPNPLEGVMMRVLPKRMIDRLAARRLGLDKI